MTNEREEPEAGGGEAERAARALSAFPLGGRRRLGDVETRRWRGWTFLGGGASGGGPPGGRPSSADPPPSCPPFASGAAPSRRGTAVRARAAERVAAAAAPRTAADLAREPVPPRQPAAQRSAGGRRGPGAPARCPAAGLPGLEPGGIRRDGPQDGQGQHRPHVRQEPAGPRARHPQPQRGRGEPGAPRGAGLAGPEPGPGADPDPDPGPGTDPDPGLQLVPEPPRPTRALPACDPGRPTPAFTLSLSLPPGAADGPWRDPSRRCQPSLTSRVCRITRGPAAGWPPWPQFPRWASDARPLRPRESAGTRQAQLLPGALDSWWGASSPRAAPLARPGRLPPGPESGLASWARVPGKVGPPLLGRGDSGSPESGRGSR